MKKAAALLAAGAMALSMLTACGSANGETASDNNTANQTESTGDTVKIGTMGPYTGNLSVYGISVLQGVELAVDEINANGGISGKKIELISFDDKGDTNEAISAYNKLRSEGVFAIVGATTSAPSIGIADIAAEEYNDGDGALVITPSGTAQDITTYGENVFRACYTDAYQGKTLANFATKSMNAKKVAIIYDNSSDYSQGVTAAFEEQIKANGAQIVAKESYGSDNVDFTTQLTNIQSTNPDILFIPDYYQKIALITAQARKLGLDTPFVGTDGWDGILDVLDKDAVGTVNDSYFSNHFSTTDEAENVQAFVKNYESKYNATPTAFSALAYDSVYMIKQAMEAGGTDAEKLVNAMKEISFDGITGHIIFDENGDPVKSVSILTLKDGVVSLKEKMDAE